MRRAIAILPQVSAYPQFARQAWDDCGRGRNLTFPARIDKVIAKCQSIFTLAHAPV